MVQTVTVFELVSGSALITISFHAIVTNGPPQIIQIFQIATGMHME
jgi:hypothetical protein